MTPAAVRKAQQRARERAAGLTTVTIVIPPACEPEVQRAAELMRRHRHLRVACLVDIQTGKLVGMRQTVKEPKPDALSPKRREFLDTIRKKNKSCEETSNV